MWRIFGRKDESRCKCVWFQVLVGYFKKRCGSISEKFGNITGDGDVARTFPRTTPWRREFQVGGTDVEKPEG